MKVTINRSEVKGKVSAPSSKSYTIRGLMCAALTRGESEIVHPLISDDTEASMEVLRQVGIHLDQKRDAWQVSGGYFHEPHNDLFCGDSAATLRFMTAICSIIPGRCILTAGSSLSKRPVGPLVQALRQLGVDCSSQGDLPPVTVQGDNLRGGVVELPGNVSSQFISALLFIAPFAKDGMTIRMTTPVESKPYILMTLDCLKKFGIALRFAEGLDQFDAEPQTYRPTTYQVEGDWSSASYFLALGALSGAVEIVNLNPGSLQGDRIMLNFLQDMGASVEVQQSSVIVRRSRLKAISADLTDCIDLLPTMAVLAAVADGESELAGIERARLKESNRVAAVREGLERMAIRVVEKKDRLIISGSEPKGSAIDSKGDHRIAMAFSILGTVAGETTIDNAQCVSKTYPEFWDHLISIGGEVNINGQ